jgi:hypothetical protein
MPPRNEPDRSGQTAAPLAFRSGAVLTEARTLALAQLAGNRATTRHLARWAAHPDPEKKGVMVPDVVAADFVRFNPPKNG